MVHHGVSERLAFDDAERGHGACDVARRKQALGFVQLKIVGVGKQQCLLYGLQRVAVTAGLLHQVTRQVPAVGIVRIEAIKLLAGGQRVGWVFGINEPCDLIAQLCPAR